MWGQCPTLSWKSIGEWWGCWKTFQWLYELMLNNKKNLSNTIWTELSPPPLDHRFGAMLFTHSLRTCRYVWCKYMSCTRTYEAKISVFHCTVGRLMEWCKLYTFMQSLTCAHRQQTYPERSFFIFQGISHSLDQMGKVWTSKDGVYLESKDYTLCI